MNVDEVNTARVRVKSFAERAGREPPARILADDDAPAPELLAFCESTGLSLDWVFGLAHTMPAQAKQELETASVVRGQKDGLPALLEHIDKWQDKTAHLCQLFEALEILDNELNHRGNCREPVIAAALSMAREIYRSLDSMNLPKVTS